ncbi:replication initiation protein [Massilia sp. DJPM01]|uniref:replication initiation protein n=1 Tax=Massilia sp. DJPM01 TaxID=3024404 RepID=UPI00259E51E8|nr:replication initiation protein [Massilia sp. DJPM01]MDM5180969.1 replication initiation protein [Massilia sp. DJPM01]
MQITWTGDVDHARDIDPTDAIARSARNLSDDERYILYRLAAGLSRDPRTTAHRGMPVLLPVAEFAQHVRLNGKRAYRRLGAATEALFGRTVEIEFGNGTELHFAWASSMWTRDDAFELNFTDTFVQHLLDAIAKSEASRSRAPLCITLKEEHEGSDNILLVALEPTKSKSKLQPRRPRRVIQWPRLLDRVKMRLKRLVSAEQADRLIELTDTEEPWRRMSRSKFHDFTTRDIGTLTAWLIDKMDTAEVMPLTIPYAG